MNLIKTKSLSDLFEKSKKMKNISSDTFINKLIYTKKYLENNKIKLFNLFTLYSNLLVFKSNNTKLKKDYSFNYCKKCGSDMDIIKNIYHNKYCSYNCYKNSLLDKSGYYNIICLKCNKIFKTTNKFTDYCSDECFETIYKKIKMI